MYNRNTARHADISRRCLAMRWPVRNRLGGLQAAYTLTGRNSRGAGSPTTRWYAKTSDYFGVTLAVGLGGLCPSNKRWAS